MNGTLFFTADDGTTGPELWKSDGTAAGTVLVKDIYPGDGGSLHPAPDERERHAVLHGRRRRPRPRAVEERRHRRRHRAGRRTSSLASSGSSLPYLTQRQRHAVLRGAMTVSRAGAVEERRHRRRHRLVKDINPRLRLGPERHAAELPASAPLFFAAATGLDELWKSDGTARHRPRQGHRPGHTARIPSKFTDVNGTLFFTAADEQSTSEASEKSDGTAAGTVLVKDIKPDGRDTVRSCPSILTAVGHPAYFMAASRTSRQRWSCGRATARGRHHPASRTSARVRDGSAPDAAPDVDGTLYLRRRTTGRHGHELWKSDGTAAGTVLVKDINPGSGRLVRPPALTDVNGTLFFTADDGANGSELWKSDGTAAGTIARQGHHAGHPGRSCRSPDERQRHAVLRGQRRQPRATSCGRATAPPPAPCWSRTSTPATASSSPASSDERERHAVLHGQRRQPRLRAVEERRHRRRHRAGQGHQPRPGELAVPAT